MRADGGAFLAYHEPGIVSILTLISFFVFLAVAETAAERVLGAGLLGHMVVGLVYGAPIANILAPEWQDAFLALGYLGLILIIFEGGLTIRLDLLAQNLVLAVLTALVGVLTPIALSFALLYAGFGYGAIEAFIVGTALCSTSLGTTFVVINNASKAVDFSQTRIGTVLISAAILDDVCGLVLVSVIQQLRGLSAGGGASTNLGWIIGRPILASSLLSLLTPLAVKFVLGPAFRRLVKAGRVRQRFQHPANMSLTVLLLSAFLAVAAYAGASVLLGAFLAGTVVSSLPGRPADARHDSAGDAALGRPPAFAETFGKYVGDVQRYVLQPLFFASIGFAIPFLELWTGEAVWKGVVFAVLMVCGKLVVGLCVPLWDLVAVRQPPTGPAEKMAGACRRRVLAASWAPGALLGTAMVARGEIGLLIIQIGLNDTPVLSRSAFVVGVWAILLNTIVGPVAVGFLVARVGLRVAENPRWGTQARRQHGVEMQSGGESQGRNGQARGSREEIPG
ncbi:Cation/H+ exchanger [Lasiosphaeria miniovina]|uniref:Cation/H+ exchanger n=1 Tax=Lasiosphaeria miniovina TaxID=1954250 RepID=A0AA40AL37_9PEZI|nr:Cation/H+ exchanger [Lasiosphaeria miniovina]KAK0717819.1 Cation/H+ exchanger [Lasiosphaeria miniovina]